jgi:hypothetical protein
LEWIKTQSNFSTVFQGCYAAEPSFRTDCTTMQKLCPVYDMRPKPASPLLVHNPANPIEILDMIYRVRCNLIHGSKIAENPRDLELIELSFRILAKVAIPILTTV